MENFFNHLRGNDVLSMHFKHSGEAGHRMICDTTSTTKKQHDAEEVAKKTSSGEKIEKGTRKNFKNEEISFFS